jgi:hypothetical protein
MHRILLWIRCIRRLAFPIAVGRLDSTSKNGVGTISSWQRNLGFAAMVGGSIRTETSVMFDTHKPCAYSKTRRDSLQENPKA